MAAAGKMTSSRMAAGAQASMRSMASDGCPRFLSFQVEKHDAVVVKAAISFRVGPPVLNRVEVVDDVRIVVLRRQMVQYIDVENGIEQEAECQRNARSGKGA